MYFQMQDHDRMLLSIQQTLISWSSFLSCQTTQSQLVDGHSSDNTSRYIHITDLEKHLGSVLYKTFPGYHALTRYDYTSPFFRKRKVNLLKMTEKNFLYLERPPELERRLPSLMTETTYNNMCVLYN